MCLISGKNLSLNVTCGSESKRCILSHISTRFMFSANILIAVLSLGEDLPPGLLIMS